MSLVSLPKELLRPEVLVWMLPCVLVCIGIGCVIGRGLALHFFHRMMNGDRQKLIKALQVLLESTEQLSLDVDTHKSELANAEESLHRIDAKGNFEAVQELLLEQISVVVASHKRLEDDLVVTRYQLQEQAHELDRTRHEAKTDNLSGLANRKAFDESIQFAIANFNRKGVPFGLALADVDHFKRINDTHGHDAGDRVVSRIGQVLRDHCRAHDIVARFGGDEFAVIFTKVNSEQVIAAAQRLRTAIERTNFDVGMGGARIAVTFSIGLAWATPGETVDSIFKKADMALYRAKHDGRNRLHIASDSDAAFIDNLTNESDGANFYDAHVIERVPS